MTNYVNQLIDELDSAELFIRNRINCNNLTLNDYDVLILKDICNTLDKTVELLKIKEDYQINGTM